MPLSKPIQFYLSSSFFFRPPSKPKILIPASSKVKENGAIYSEKGELLSVGSRRKHELPQTGLHDNSLIAAIGSLLAGISIFGLLGGRKKKDDDKQN